MANDKHVMLSALQGAGAQGATRDELFDVAIAQPSRLAELLRADGHGIIEELERVKGTVDAWTTRFTLIIDASDQPALFEGDRTGNVVPLAA